MGTTSGETVRQGRKLGPGDEMHVLLRSIFGNFSDGHQLGDKHLIVRVRADLAGIDIGLKILSQTMMLGQLMKGVQFTLRQLTPGEKARIVFRSFYGQDIEGVRLDDARNDVVLALRKVGIDLDLDAFGPDHLIFDLLEFIEASGE